VRGEAPQFRGISFLAEEARGRISSVAVRNGWLNKAMEGPWANGGAAGDPGLLCPPRSAS